MLDEKRIQKARYLDRLSANIEAAERLLRFIGLSQVTARAQTSCECLREQGNRGLNNDPSESSSYINF